MGLFDKIQGAAQQYADQQQTDSTAALASAFPPGTTIPRTDLVGLSPRYRQATVAAYIATVGLAPEDVYAVIPEVSNDVTVSFQFVYRDRPEYEAGRQGWVAGGS